MHRRAEGPRQQHRRQRQHDEGPLEPADPWVPGPRVVSRGVADVEICEQPGVPVLLAHVPSESTW